MFAPAPQGSAPRRGLPPPSSTLRTIALQIHTIVDMAQYLTRLPQDSLPRSVMLLLTGGHLAGGTGIAQFMDRHKDDGLTQRMAAMLGIGQLGALEVLPDSNGYLHLTGRSEPAALFSPRTPVLMEAS